MFKRAKIKKGTIALGLTAVLLILFSWYLINRFSHAKVLEYYPIHSKADTSLTIGIIGASSAAGQQFDGFLHKELSEKGFENRIISSGHPGVPTKMIYQNLFRESNKEHSSKPIIESNPRYCIVIGGINDAVSQLGSNYYAFHITQIIKTLLHYNIKPVIVSLPNAGIKEANSKMNFFNRYMNIAASYFNNNGELDNVMAYRTRLEKKLAEEQLKDSIIMIDFDLVCAAYGKCPGVFADPIHLSSKGKEMLCRVIADKLATDIRRP
ncbi:MAG TPA: SGNH/GDSL hydrolase family protein [Ferruginibacter sp.]|nr:SGNH/GDSL hydrolase family protein [Ferruginibacter sp.]